MPAPLRQLGNSNLWVSPISLGCWPMAGISSLGIDDQQSIATIHAAIDSGVNHFDTAFSYGYDGRSDRVLREALRSRSEKIVIATKVGMHYDSNRNRVLDASPSRMRWELDSIRTRLDLDVIDLLYLHSPDGVTPIEKSAETLATFIDQGLVRYAGVSNVNAEEAFRFSKSLKPVVIQPPFNMLQQATLKSLLPFCESASCGVACYWPLMKGLLAGKMLRDHSFDPADRRLTYPIFQGDEWQRSQDFLDVLRRISSDIQVSIATIVTRWTMMQPGVTTVLCGAKRPDQIRESAAAMDFELPADACLQIDQAIEKFTSSVTYN